MSSGEVPPAPLFSAVIPCLNEQENVAAIASAVAAQFDILSVSYEILFIDNNSTDDTIAAIKALCARDPRIRLIVNNRNYGQMRSPTHGIYQTAATGAVIGISADFQDPPELIAEMVARWRMGFKIVLAVRASEKTPFVVTFARAVGYRLMQRFGDYSVIPGATGFGLYDRQVVDTLKQWRDPEPFFRGMLVESGYSLTTIDYHRPERAGGRTKNNFRTILAFFFSGLASSSKKLLRLPIYVALLMLFSAAVTFIYAMVLIGLGRSPWTCLASLAIQVAFGAIFLFLGLLGEQIRLIAETVRNTPLVVERERVNFPASPSSSSAESLGLKR